MAIKFSEDAQAPKPSKAQRKAFFEALAAEFQVPAHMLAGQSKASFDRTAYQREYMRKRRARQAEKREQEK
jgi:hypothetical protein